MEQQPAIKSYFFGEGYSDLKNTISECWSNNLESASDFFTSGSTFWEDDNHLLKIVALGYHFAALSVLVFGTAFFAALSLVHIIALGVFYLGVFSAYWTVLGIEKLYMAKNRIFSACPVCHEKFDIPCYLCPSCNRAHSRLIPSSYGIFKRTCECDEVIPCSFLNGRSDLKAECPACKHDIESAESTPICLPIVGGPNAGKTFFMYTALQTILEDFAPDRDWGYAFLNSQNESQYEQLKHSFDRGQAFLKTVEVIPRAFNVFLQSQRWKPDKLLYLYDAAGEAYQDSDTLKDHRYYDYLHGMFFIIDPFSLPELRNEYDASIQADPTLAQFNSDSLDDIFDRLILNFEEQFSIGRNKQIDAPCAVIINKVDVFDLSERIGLKAVSHKMAENKISFEQAQNEICRGFFAEYGYHNFLNKLESKFKHYRFFTCTTTGHAPNGKAFKPLGVLEPVQWILSKADRHMKSELKAFVARSLNEV